MNNVGVRCTSTVYIEFGIPFFFLSNINLLCNSIFLSCKAHRNSFIL